MKKKYIFTLFLIGFLLVITLTIGTGYGLWVSINNKEEKAAQTLDCFKMYFSDSDEIEISDVKAVLKEEGMLRAPNTITITNICDEELEVEIRLSVLKETTIDYDSLTVTASGYVEQEPILYKNLARAKTKDENIKESKIIGKINVKPKETIRTNVKYWFDERKAPNFKPEEIFKARYDIIDSAKYTKPTLANAIIGKRAEEIAAKGNPDFSQIAFNDEGLYLYEKDGEKVYYYRGNVYNNYVKFADQLWRIIGINTNGTVKVILDKSAGNNYFSRYDDSKDYSGLKYIYNNATTNNDVLDYLDEWYKNNITNKGLDSFVAFTSFCNDTSSYQSDNNTIFYGNDRLMNKTPSLTCPDTNNDFGGKYNTKVGLITIDEVILAGGLYDTNNTSYYLYNGESFFTLTPSNSTTYGYVSRVYVYSVNADGAVNSNLTTDELGIRPVISLDKTVEVDGEGTLENPFIVDTEELED